MIDISRFQGRKSADPSNLILVDGSFAASDAGNAASSILAAASNFYKLQDLREQIQTEQHDSNASIALEDLESSQAALNELIQRAHESGARVRINSYVELELEDDNFAR